MINKQSNRKSGGSGSKMATEKRGTFPRAGNARKCACAAKWKPAIADNPFIC